MEIDLFKKICFLKISLTPLALAVGKGFKSIIEPALSTSRYEKIPESYNHKAVLKN